MASCSSLISNDMPPKVIDALNLITSLNSKVTSTPLSEQSLNINLSTIRNEVGLKSSSSDTSQTLAMGQINKLKNRLNERKSQEWKELEDALTNAKKRAENIERVNYVNGFLESLDSGLYRIRKGINMSKCEGLNLPKGKVSAMKARWEEFERSDWNNPSTSSSGKGYRNGARNEPVNSQRIDYSNVRRLSELTGWLDEFAKKNKVHTKKHSLRPSAINYKTRSSFCILPDDV